MTANTTADPTTQSAVDLADRPALQRTVGTAGPFRVRLLVLGLALLAAFGLLSVLASANGYFPADVPIERWLQAQLGGTAPWFFHAVSSLNGSRQTLAGILLLAVVILVNPRTILFAFLASLTGPIYVLVSGLVLRPRPTGQLVQVSEHLGGSSFPSGHATFAATYAALLVLCIGGKYLRRNGLIVASAVAVAIVLAFGVARIVTGGHWPSDVLGGFLLAGGWMSTLLSVRFIGDPVLKWLGDPSAAWKARHPTTPYSWGGRAQVLTRVVYTPAVQVFERFGFVVRGLVWALMGVFALAAVLDLGRSIDLYGSVTVLESNGFRGLIAFLIAVGLSGYALWGFNRALADPLQRGTSASGLMARMGYLSSAVSYVLLAVFAADIGLSASGVTASTGSASQPPFGASLIATLEGIGLLYVIGAGVVVVGLGQLLDSWQAPFIQDVLWPDAPHGRLWITWIWLGRTGLFARGVLFLISGGLILVAGWTKGSWSASFAHAFDASLGFPAGRVLVALLALGMIALGLHSFGAARWIRMRPPVLVRQT